MKHYVRMWSVKALTQNYQNGRLAGHHLAHCCPVEILRGMLGCIVSMFSVALFIGHRLYQCVIKATTYFFSKWVWHINCYLITNFSKSMDTKLTVFPYKMKKTLVKSHSQYRITFCTSKIFYASTCITVKFLLFFIIIRQINTPFVFIPWSYVEGCCVQADSAS